MKDVTSTSFGLVIAYLLPGFAAFFALSFWSPPISDLFSKFLEAESNIGRFLLVIVCSLIAGLEVTIFRWIFFEKWLCRKTRLDRAKFAHLGIEAKLTAFRAAVDEHYRYHQFWGGMAVAIPFIGFGIATSSATVFQGTIICGAFLVLEVVTIIAACSAFQKYVDSASNILEGFDYAQRLGENRERGLGTPTSAPTGAQTGTTPSSTSASTAKATAAATAEKMIKPETEESCAVTEASTPEAAIGSAKSQKD